MASREDATDHEQRAVVVGSPDPGLGQRQPAQRLLRRLGGGLPQPHARELHQAEPLHGFPRLLPHQRQLPRDAILQVAVLGQYQTLNVQTWPTC